MRPGIRLQLLLALAGMMLLAFVPLYFAVVGLTHSTLQSSWDLAARSMGRAVAAHVLDARTTRLAHELGPLLQAEIGYGGVTAIAIYDAQGNQLQHAGDTPAAASLPRTVPGNTERTRTIETAEGRALEVLVPSSDGSVLAIVRTDDETVRAQPLVRLVGYYTAFFALAFLVFTYMALTYVIVRPLDRLVVAASRVSAGARKLEVPRAGAREIAALGASFSEMTQQLRSEEETLRQKVHELEKTTDDLRSAQRTLVRSERLASVGKLSAGLAHEIGNPIAAILGLLDLMLSEDLSEQEQKDFLLRMRKETERIHETLRQLLDFARPATASHDRTGEEPCFPHQAIEDACALIEPQRAYRNIELVREIHATELVSLARGHLTQVLINLLLNAADAVAGKGRVWVRLKKELAGACLEVEDDGPGISDEIRDALFEPFVTTKEVGAGTGLGLAVCRGLIESAGGTIHAEDGEYGGARFVVKLPWANPDTDSIGESSR
ncbi:MAG TPA: HAMP domain-containing sensor histidine kinase [Polyangiaceae bacterium]|nr:HAMP domain-containing sensor histidine kinase [Polyangiaceae bacterium]HOT08456.1 HAMP domain-containing sensor histidine kinase [Polyangiaceae bacterium]HPB94359.1 HAMP domain-containing sensor histidine kinase [Polyangiaceae bacterium]HQB42287.1 HAMP domain-containing sensor histidine kinase [Polyangiaceae bacterium]